MFGGATNNVATPNKPMAFGMPQPQQGMTTPQTGAANPTAFKFGT